MATGFLDSFVSPEEISTTVRKLSVCRSFHDDEIGHGRLVFLFHINGKRELQFDDRETHVLNEPSLAVFYQPEGMTKRNIWPEGVVDVGISIAVYPECVLDSISSCFPMLPGWSEILDDRNSLYWRECPLPYSVAQVVHQAIEADIREGLVDQYVHVKSRELLLLAIDSLLRHSQEVSRSNSDRQKVDQVRALVEVRLKERLTLEELADEVDIAKSVLARGMKGQTGMSFGQYVFERRMVKARALLEGKETPLKQVAYEAGYRHTSNFCIAFKRRFGLTPIEARGFNGIVR